MSDSIRKSEPVSRNRDKTNDHVNSTGHPTIRTRPCGPVDLTCVVKIVTESGLSGEGLDDQFGEAYVVAELAGEIVGCAGIEVHGSHGLLRSVAVVPRCQGAKIGEVLVGDRLEWARARGVAAVYLLTETASSYFERLGFEKIPRSDVPAQIAASHEFSVMCPESADVMVLHF